MTAWSALADDVVGTPYSLLIDKHPARGRINRLIRKSRTGLHTINAMLTAIVDAQSNVAVAAQTRKQVQGVADPSLGSINLGGARTIETRTLRASGNITAAEEADLLTIMSTVAAPSTYPADASGNGGGGKVGGF